MNKIVLASLFMLLLACHAFAQKDSSEEQALKKADVPKAILTAFGKAYPKAKVKGYSKETGKGKVLYEVESKEGSVARDVSYDSVGNLLTVEESVRFSELPQAVRDAVHKQYPKSKNLRCEKIQEGTSIRYEVLLRSGKKQTELVFDADGKVIEQEEANPAEKD